MCVADDGAMQGVADCVFCGRRNTWRSFALCSAVKLWRAVVLRGRSFSAAVHSVLRCGRALFC